MLVEIVFQLPVVILSPEASLIVPSLTLPFLCMAVHAFPSFFLPHSLFFPFIIYLLASRPALGMQLNRKSIRKEAGIEAEKEIIT